MASNFDYLSALKSVENNNKVGTIESMLSGVASGLIGCLLYTSPSPRD